MRELDRPVKVKYVSFALTACSLAALLVYSLIGLPLQDYTAFRPGAMLQAAADEEYRDFTEPEFIYEKDGVTRAFALDALPDSSWTFVDSRIRQDDFASGTVLSLTDAAGEYCDTVASQGNVLVISAYKNLSAKRLSGLEQTVSHAELLGLRPVVVVPSRDILAAASVTPSDPGADVLSGIVLPQWLDDITRYSDFKTIATLNRSNGGVTWISDGQIVRKWSCTLRPSLEKLESALEEDPAALALETQSRGSLALQGFLLYVFAVLLLL